MGSFAGAQVWRLRARQLRDDDKRWEQLSSKKTLTKAEAEDKHYLKSDLKARRQERAQLDVLLSEKARSDRSRCLQCGHSLAWYDLLPLVSWLGTGGKCRYCKKPIGLYEPLVELSTAGLFVASYLFWPFQLAGKLDWLMLAVWLVALVLMVILFIYDKKWFILPDSINFSLAAVGAIFAGLMVLINGLDGAAVISLVGAVAIMSGIYWLLNVYSGGVWVGLGDVKLGVGLGLLLGRWELAFLALFLANLIGTLLVIPGLASGRLNRQSQVPFGPLLIVGTIVAVLFGQVLIEQFLQLSLVLF